MSACALMPDLVEGASAIFDNGELRLDVSVPQKAMMRSARGYVDPKHWDDGITAAMLQYNANAYRSENLRDRPPSRLPGVECRLRISDPGDSAIPVA